MPYDLPLIYGDCGGGVNYLEWEHDEWMASFDGDLVWSQGRRRSLCHPTTRAYMSLHSTLHGLIGIFYSALPRARGPSVGLALDDSQRRARVIVVGDVGDEG